MEENSRPGRFTAVVTGDEVQKASRTRVSIVLPAIVCTVLPMPQSRLMTLHRECARPKVPA